MNSISEEQAYAYAIAKGWIQAPTNSTSLSALSQPATPAHLGTSTPCLTLGTSLAPPAATVASQPANSSTLASAQPARPRQPSAPLPNRIRPPMRPPPGANPTCVEPSNQVFRPPVPLAHATPMVSAHVLLPAVAPAPLLVSTPAVAPTTFTGPAPVAQIAPTAQQSRSGAPVRPLGTVRAARQAAIRAPTGGGATSARHAKNKSSYGDRPPLRILTPEERSEIAFKARQYLSGGTPFDVPYVANANPGGQKYMVDVGGILGMSKNQMDVTRGTLKLILGHTPGVDMTQTYAKNPRYAIMQAFDLFYEIFPGFKAYAGQEDDWPAWCITSRILRLKANIAQGKQRKQARNTQANPTPSPAPEDVVAAQVEDVPVEPLVANYDPVLDLVNDVGNMSVDPATHADDEVLEPFALPMDWGKCVPDRTPTPDPTVSSPSTVLPSSSSHPSTHPNTQQVAPVNVAATATATATLRSTSKAASVATASIQSTTPVVPATPRRAPLDTSFVTPGLLNRLALLKDIPESHFDRYPPETAVMLAALKKMNPTPGDPIDTSALISTIKADSVQHPSPHGSEPEDHVEGASSGLSGTEAELDEDRAKVNGAGKGKGKAKKGQSTTTTDKKKPIAPKRKRKVAKEVAEEKPRRETRSEAAARPSNQTPAPTKPARRKRGKD